MIDGPYIIEVDTSVRLMYGSSDWGFVLSLYPGFVWLCRRSVLWLHDCVLHSICLRTSLCLIDICPVRQLWNLGKILSPPCLLAFHCRHKEDLILCLILTDGEVT